MLVPHSIILFDASTVAIMVITAYLSRRLGDALKIKPYYRILYYTSFVIAITAIFETILSDNTFVIPLSVSISVRFISAVIAFFVSLRYWSWLFSEYMKK